MALGAPSRYPSLRVSIPAMQLIQLFEYSASVSTFSHHNLQVGLKCSSYFRSWNQYWKYMGEREEIINIRYNIDVRRTQWLKSRPHPLFLPFSPSILILYHSATRVNLINPEIQQCFSVDDLPCTQIHGRREPLPKHRPWITRNRPFPRWVVISKSAPYIT